MWYSGSSAAKVVYTFSKAKYYAIYNSSLSPYKFSVIQIFYFSYDTPNHTSK